MRKAKLRVAVLMGGPSAEHEVSLKTGAQVLKFLDKTRYAASPVVISKTGKWPLTLAAFKRTFDLAFLALHGEYGEDGTIQKILERAKIPFTGSGSRASAFGMDKNLSARLFRRAGLFVPQYEILHLPIIRIIGRHAVLVHIPFSAPLVVKPVDRGSSVGVTIVRHKRDLRRAIRHARKYSSRVMMQEYIKGRELTCGVLEITNNQQLTTNNKKLVALPVTEIVPKTSAFFDYEAKYTAGASREITPARISKALARKVQRAALAAHRAIGARGYSRTDFIWDSKTLWILEINTLPGLTRTSLVPQEAAAAGISFPQLLDYIIAAAL